ncbi:hypothetical protein ASD15_14135 [Massilia sp. Root351]|jgi:hypothetical protein|uniref:hypothetical protein n=1 Tax=Massilia sp. Root351 TaxID=1736522 RepID=UPI00070BF270|nr:hypothetical protein [Massilia sp. Root351]KQV81016.1 hypothetical protein ASD15_14135 [Massilia sp. Root351]
MKMIIEQLAQQARSGREPGRQRERQSEAFQAAIDFYRLDVGHGPRPARPVPVDAGEPAPPVIHPNT